MFFLLLNVDTVLKENMFLSESEAQKSKLSNFFMNLRKHIIPDYMASEQFTPSTCVSVSSRMLYSKSKNTITFVVKTKNLRRFPFISSCRCSHTRVKK